MSINYNPKSTKLGADSVGYTNDYIFLDKVH